MLGVEAIRYCHACALCDCVVNAMRKIRFDHQRNVQTDRRLRAPTPMTVNFLLISLIVCKLRTARAHTHTCCPLHASSSAVHPNAPQHTNIRTTEIHRATSMNDQRTCARTANSSMLFAALTRNAKLMRTTFCLLRFDDALWAHRERRNKKCLHSEIERYT